MNYSEEQLQKLYSNNELAGEFFGFPRCCVDEFKIKEAKHFFPWRPGEKEMVADRGFRPCDKHYKEIIDGKLKLEDLIQNRICSLPFPFPNVDGFTLKYFSEWQEFLKNKKFKIIG